MISLQGADDATVGAVAGPLSADLGIGNTSIGLLVSLSSAAGVVAALPMGVLADRVRRVPVLSVAIVVWSLVSAASGFAGSFPMLLFTRLALGAVLATATPMVASLIGDYFPGAERARIYGYVLAGELVGTGAGFLVSGTVAGLVSWRVAFFVLAGAGIGLAGAIHRLLSEPMRGAQPLDLQDVAVAGRVLGQSPATPEQSRVLAQSPQSMSVWAAVRYVLSIRTNVVLIVASALTYFFFSGMRTFAVEYLAGRFGLPQPVASLVVVLVGSGSVVGVLLAPRIAERLRGRGVVSGCPLVAGAALVVVVVLTVPSLLVGSLLLAAPLLFVGAAAYGAINPTLDAARLDIMHHQLWGRAEAVRTVLRSSFTAFAPLTFGFVSSRVGGPSGLGLGPTFLLMLIPVAAAAWLLLVQGVRTYSRDVATAAASEQRWPAGPDVRN
ncbi:MAG: MFS transporter [Actinomycetota bacterium]|nr:MFS transporter [Actinomycetota bacterium]